MPLPQLPKQQVFFEERRHTLDLLEKCFRILERSESKSIRRLGEVKSKWDGKNMFRTNRNIRPA